MGETDLHKYGKKCLVELLKSGIKVNCNSEICNFQSNNACMEVEIENNYVQGKADVAYEDSDGDLIVFEVKVTHPTKECDRNDYIWHEFNANDIIQLFYLYRDNNCQDFILNCCNDHSYIDQFDLLEEFDDEDEYPNCSKIEYPPGKFIIRQRGAGCGKTYDSVKEIINSNKEIYQVFIYLTKMHSAKSVIKNELFNQHKKYIINDNNRNKQYLYKLKYGDNDIKVVIGTVDSFNYKIGNIDNVQTFNIFTGLCQDIINIDKEKNPINYFYGNVDFNNLKTMIVIDEVQDLDLIYINALISIRTKFVNIDYMCIGDKLQSLYNDNNIFNNFKNLLKNENLEIIIDTPVNNVRRFHNFKFLSLLNKGNISCENKHTCNEKLQYDETLVTLDEHCNCQCDFISNCHKTSIKFEHFKLPIISSGCPGKVNQSGICEYGFYHDYSIFNRPINNPNWSKIAEYNKEKLSYKNDNLLTTFFKYPHVYFNDYQIEKINKVIEFEILNRLELLIQCTKQNKLIYTPQDVMIIFPILKNNQFIAILESRLNDFWKEKFLCKDYLKYCSDEDRELFSLPNFIPVEVHKSEIGSSINLDTSINKTRIMSIHSSKGTGRKIVFVFNLQEIILNKFQTRSGELKYESMIHVALTRQKEHLFVGFNIHDDISSRFLDWSGNKKYDKGLQVEKLIDFICHCVDYKEYDPSNKKKWSESLVKMNLDNKDFILNLVNHENQLVDISDHTVRNIVYKFTFLLSISSFTNKCIQQNMQLKNLDKIKIKNIFWLNAESYIKVQSTLGKLYKFYIKWKEYIYNYKNIKQYQNEILKPEIVEKIKLEKKRILNTMEKIKNTHFGNLDLDNQIKYLLASIKSKITSIKMKDIEKNKEQNLFFPVLRFLFFKNYKNAISNILKKKVYNIMALIRHNKLELKYITPLDHVILNYMISSMTKIIPTEITLDKLYYIISVYGNMFIDNGNDNSNIYTNANTNADINICKKTTESMLKHKDKEFELFKKNYLSKSEKSDRYNLSFTCHYNTIMHAIKFVDWFNEKNLIEERKFSQDKKIYRHIKKKYTKINLIFNISFYESSCKNESGIKIIYIPTISKLNIIEVLIRVRLMQYMDIDNIFIISPTLKQPIQMWELNCPDEIFDEMIIYYVKNYY